MKTLLTLFASTCLLTAQVTNQLQVLEITMPCPWEGCGGQFVEDEDAVIKTFIQHPRVFPPAIYLHLCTSNQLHSCWYTNRFPRFKTNRVERFSSLDLTNSFTTTKGDGPAFVTGKHPVLMFEETNAPSSWHWYPPGSVIPQTGDAGGFWVKEKTK